MDKHYVYLSSLPSFTKFILLYSFRKGQDAVQGAKKLHEVCTVMKTYLKERQCRNWFEKFRSGDFCLKDEQRSGRPVVLNEVEIKIIIEADRHVTTRKIAEKLNVSYTAIEKRLKRVGLVKKLDIWVPHDLNNVN
ncbi:histone-lysine N-methyltransferase SETMAR-like [Glossina fuscipes]|uniref:Histone-lysine N-methyltransferase SETMAR-like n=1 Tax=Glossina fuscipes TaxID=7396 RepID=A0A8U0WG69_9MUSC|nr:histone-lysine N-methyltransferase SETMAR-like [Glossina fuscipes]